MEPDALPAFRAWEVWTEKNRDAAALRETLYEDLGFFVCGDVTITAPSGELAGFVTADALRRAGHEC